MWTQILTVYYRFSKKREFFSTLSLNPYANDKNCSLNRRSWFDTAQPYLYWGLIFFFNLNNKYSTAITLICILIEVKSCEKLMWELKSTIPLKYSSWILVRILWVEKQFMSCFQIPNCVKNRQQKLHCVPHDIVSRGENGCSSAPFDNYDAICMTLSTRFLRWPMSNTKLHFSIILPENCVPHTMVANE